MVENVLVNMEDECPAKDWCGLYEKSICKPDGSYTDCPTYKLFERERTEGEMWAERELEIKDKDMIEGQ